MQSPKFAHKASQLKAVVSSTVLADLWKSSVRERLRTQIVPDAVEYIDFHIHHKQRCAEIQALVCSGDYEPKPILRLKAEKSKGLCRQLSLPSPEDALILQALSNFLWKEIAPNAPSETAFFAPQDQAFSVKNPASQEDEWGYGPLESWLDFQREILKFSQTRPIVVVTDVANYYDCIIHSHLRAILSDYAGKKEFALDLLLYVLDAMLWRPDYMPNYGIGLPQMDLDAPRLLAHTHLFEVDRIFSTDPDVDYARYMDDIDFGVQTKAKAKTLLRDLDLALQTRNLRLNNGKTLILSAIEALRHFRAVDNAALEKMRIRWNRDCYLDKKFKLYLKMYERALEWGVSRKYFDNGNGDKILKRLINLLAKNGGIISDSAFRHLLYEKPGLRKELLNYWARSPSFSAHFRRVAGFLNSGEAVDDLSKVLLATSVAAAHHSIAIDPTDQTLALYSLSRSEPFELYARLWVIARTKSPDDLWSEIKDTKSEWSRYRFLGRLVAAFHGILKCHANFEDYLTLVRRWGGADAGSVLDLHIGASSVPATYYSTVVFIREINPSQPTGISFPKSLLLASALWNQAISKADRSKLLANHKLAMTDRYYFAQFANIMTLSM